VYRRFGALRYEEINVKGKFVEKREYRNSFVKFEQQNICLNRLTIDIFLRSRVIFIGVPKEDVGVCVPSFPKRISIVN
jgi:hypothetical protein